MRHDIHKLGVWLENICREGVATEHKVVEWKSAGKPGKRAAIQGELIASIYRGAWLRC